MGRWSLTRVGRACVAALLLSSTARAALLNDGGAAPSESSPSWYESVTQVDWWTERLPSGATGGSQRQPSDDWSEPLPSATSGGALRLSLVTPRLMLGGLSAPRADSLLDIPANADAPVPLPATLWLFGSGAVALMPVLRRRPRRNGGLA